MEMVHNIYHRKRHTQCRLYEKEIDAYFYSFYSPCIQTVAFDNNSPKVNHCIEVTKHYWANVNTIQTYCGDIDFGLHQNDRWQEEHSFFVDVVKPLDRRILQDTIDNNDVYILK